MATTSPDNIYSPDPNTLYNFVTDLRNMAVSIQTALSRRVSGVRGTTAEMNAALSSSPLEATWFNTTDNLWYVKNATAWVEAGPNSFRGPATSRNAYPNVKAGMRWFNTTTEVPEQYLSVRSGTNPFGPATAGWYPSDRLPVETYGLLSNAVPNGAVVSVPPSTRVVADSNSQFLTVASGGVSVAAAGVFSVSGIVRLNASTTGRSFVDVTAGGVLQGRFGITQGEDLVAFTLPAVILAADGSVTVQVFKTATPASSNVTGSIRLTRVGSL